MSERSSQSVFWPILIGVVASLFAIAILVAWSIIFTQFYYVADKELNFGVGYWLILSFGCLFLLIIVAVIIVLFISNIKQILYMRKQTAFIDSVTHELKSPLASIRLGLETMERRTLEPKMQKRFLMMMVKDVDRLTTFIEHILQVGRLDEDERIISETAIDIAAVIDECATRIRKRHELTEHSMQVSIDLPDVGERRLMLDKVALETVLLNLLDNAAKYSKEQVNIRICVRAIGKQLVVDVADSGLGIPQAQLKQVLRRFFRVARPDRMTIRGTGLGLYVVDMLVGRMGGQTTVESPGINQGTTVTLKLPLRLERVDAAIAILEDKEDD